MRTRSRRCKQSRLRTAHSRARGRKGEGGEGEGEGEKEEEGEGEGEREGEGEGRREQDGRREGAGGRGVMAANAGVREMRRAEALAAAAPTGVPRAPEERPVGAIAVEAHDASLVVLVLPPRTTAPAPAHPCACADRATASGGGGATRGVGRGSGNPLGRSSCAMCRGRKRAYRVPCFCLPRRRLDRFNENTVVVLIRDTCRSICGIGDCRIGNHDF